MYIELSTGRYPVSENDIRAENPSISFPTPFAPPAGFAWVYPVPAPEFDPLIQRVEQVAPTEFDGMWFQTWQVIELYGSQEEIDAAMAQRLAVAKEAKNAEINAARLAANFGTFTYLDMPIACDELSRNDIDGVNGYVALFGEMPPGWPGGWKTATKEVGYVPLPNVVTWKDFYSCMIAAGLANFAHAQALKEQLSLAQTVEEVQAIAW